MIIIHTGNNEIDRILEKEIKNSAVISYADFIIEDDKFKNQTIILSSNSVKENLNKYLYSLRSKNIRVILLIPNKNQEETKIALQYGIYDLIFGNFYPSQIQKVIDNPKTFQDIAKIYEKLFNIKGGKQVCEKVKKY